MDAVDPHASGEVAEQFVIFGLRTQNLDVEGGIGKRFHYQTDELYDIFRHRSKQKEMNRKSRGILQSKSASSKPESANWREK